MLDSAPTKRNTLGKNILLHTLYFWYQLTFFLYKTSNLQTSTEFDAKLAFHLHELQECGYECNFLYKVQLHNIQLNIQYRRGITIL
jgi:hypothetical protein